MSREFEYAVKEKLHGSSAVFFRIPESVLMDSNAPPETLVAFSYLSVKCGIDGTAMISLNHMASWSGRKPDKHKGKVNDRLLKSLSYISDIGYASFKDDPSHATFAEVRFDKDAVDDVCDESKKSRYAVLYVDEVDKIMSSDIIPSIDKESSLLLLAYLKMIIPRRKNELYAEEGNARDRRIRYPEAYNARYIDIAEELNMSPRTVSNAADALKSLGIVYSESMPRERGDDGEWYTGHTLFCNFYKREGGNLLASGEGYYLNEIDNKKDMLRNLKKKR